jgi:acyl-CoA thioesterase-1
MSPHEGWVALLSNQLQAQSLNYHVVNASVSGETTGGGRARINGTLEIHNPDVIVLELGGNDGLRGYPIDNIRNNLIDMVKASQASGAKVLVIGMILPPNYGRRYTRAFEGLFSDVADRTGVALIPALLDGIDTAPELLQRDGIHPTADAQPRLLADIWPALKTLLPQ